MPKGFLAGGKDRLLISRLQVDYPLRREARLEEGGGEEVGARDAPEHHSLGARGQACCEQSRGRAVDRAGTPTRDLMQGAERQAAAGKPVVERGHAEGQDALAWTAARLDLGDLGA